MHCIFDQAVSFPFALCFANPTSVGNFQQPLPMLPTTLYLVPSQALKWHGRIVLWMWVRKKIKVSAKRFTFRSYSHPSSHGSEMRHMEPQRIGNRLHFPSIFPDRPRPMVLSWEAFAHNSKNDWSNYLEIFFELYELASIILFRNISATHVPQLHDMVPRVRSNFTYQEIESRLYHSYRVPMSVLVCSLNMIRRRETSDA